MFNSSTLTGHLPPSLSIPLEAPVTQNSYPECGFCEDTSWQERTSGWKVTVGVRRAHSTAVLLVGAGASILLVPGNYPAEPSEARLRARLLGVLGFS